MRRGTAELRRGDRAQRQQCGAENEGRSKHLHETSPSKLGRVPYWNQVPLGLDDLFQSMLHRALHGEL
jgi:hypothetical protein